MYQSSEKNDVRIERNDLQVEQVVTKRTTQKKTTEKYGVKDLCSNCDYDNHCALRISEQPVFQCEHYM